MMEKEMILNEQEVKDVNEQFSEFLKTKGIKAKFNLVVENLKENTKAQHAADVKQFNEIKQKSIEENKDFVEFLHTKGLKAKVRLVIENIKKGAKESKEKTKAQIEKAKALKNPNKVMTINDLNNEFNAFLKQKVEEFYLERELRTIELYDFVANKELRYLFAMLHQEFNRLFKFMYSKAKTNNHYNALESRELLKYIELFHDMKYILKGTGNNFKIDEKYQELITSSEKFLQESGGSSIPPDIPKITLTEYEPIFDFDDSIKVKNIK